MKIKLVFVAVLVIALTGCKSITKAVIGLKDDKAALFVESMSMGGAHKLKRMNPGPGHSVTILPDGTMKMEWVGTNGAPQTPVNESIAPRWSVPLIIDPDATPAPLVKPQSRNTVPRTITRPMTVAERIAAEMILNPPPESQTGLHDPLPEPPVTNSAP